MEINECSLLINLNSIKTALKKLYVLSVITVITATNGKTTVRWKRWERRDETFAYSNVPATAAITAQFKWHEERWCLWVPPRIRRAQDRSSGHRCFNLRQRYSNIQCHTLHHTHFFVITILCYLYVQMKITLPL